MNRVKFKNLDNTNESFTLQLSKFSCDFEMSHLLFTLITIMLVVTTISLVVECYEYCKVKKAGDDDKHIV
jgi:hypothetical protein